MKPCFMFAAPSHTPSGVSANGRKWWAKCLTTQLKLLFSLFTVAVLFIVLLVFAQIKCCRM